MSTHIQSSLAAGRCKIDSNLLELQLKTGIVYSALVGKFLRKEFTLIVGVFVGFVFFFLLFFFVLHFWCSEYTLHYLLLVIVLLFFGFVSIHMRRPLAHS